MDYAYELQDEAFFLGPYKPMKIKRKPSDYMKMLYMDTVCYNTPAVKMVLEWLGPDHVLYGSDAPPLTSLKPRAIKLIQDLDIPAADKDKIFWSNARKLLKLNSLKHLPRHARCWRHTREASMLMLLHSIRNRCRLSFKS